MIDLAWLQLAPMRGDATWTCLAEAVATGDLLLHGSQAPGLTELKPRAPIDHRVDVFSKQTAVVATEDPTWAISYGIRSASCRRFLNACFYPASSAGDWSQRRIFLSYAATEDGHAPTGPGVVYALPIAVELPVAPENLPTAPLLHDFDMVTEHAAEDPHGFPRRT